MSLIPYLLKSELRPSRRRDHLLGLELSSDDYLADLFERPIRKYIRPWRSNLSSLSSLMQDVGSKIKCDKDKFQINLDVQHFAPEEVTVKIIDNFIVVEGEHEEKEDDHGYVSRKFKRRYTLPEGYNAEVVESRLSSDGVLSITAPKKALDKAEKLIPIMQTGPVRRKIQDDDAHDDMTNNTENGPEETKPVQKKRKR